MTATTIRPDVLARGCVDLPGIVPDALWDLLHAESEALRPGMTMAVWEESRGVAKFRDGSFSSPARFGYHAGGRVLRAFHTARATIAAIREATGRERLIPYQCSYNYYRRGDYLCLHRDTIKATITCTFGLTRNLGAMCFAPALRDARNDDLERLVAEAGPMPAGFDELPTEYHVVRGFHGYDVPHWRRPFEHDLGVLGVFSYFDLGNDHLVARQ
ncbi:hypothetical protein [Sphaerisporangium aureirubrum]|uniref:2OG-Fe(II) oxygenase n=1 Tax=Sphaerisporangium aureirubrum TaxID=1544736 RepID=A0ABW1NUZ2_9ACTN